VLLCFNWSSLLANCFQAGRQLRKRFGGQQNLIVRTLCLNARSLNYDKTCNAKFSKLAQNINAPLNSVFTSSDTDAKSAFSPSSLNFGILLRRARFN